MSNLRPGLSLVAHTDTLSTPEPLRNGYRSVLANPISQGVPPPSTPANRPPLSFHWGAYDIPSGTGHAVHASGDKCMVQGLM
jgi:hypothetical protein